MIHTKEEILKQIQTNQEKINHLFETFWVHYSNLGTWQWWAMLLLLILPLIALYFLLNRRHALTIGFYGLCVHVLFSYINGFMEKGFLWFHPYQLLKQAPITIPVTASLVPVWFMMFYQYSIKKHKNFYIVAIVLAISEAYIVAGILYLLGLLKFGNNFHIYYIIPIDYIVALIAYFLTKLFQKAQVGNPN